MQGKKHPPGHAPGLHRRAAAGILAERFSFSLGPQRVFITQVSKNPIILLPGLHGSVRLFEPLVQQLRTRLPGREIIPLPLPPDSPQDYPTLLEHFAKRLEKQGPFVLVAESFSSPLALHLAASERLGVQGLVLAAGFCGPPRPLGFSLLPLRPLFALRVPKAAIRHFLAGEGAGDACVEAIRVEIQTAHGKLLASRVRSSLGLSPDEVPAPEKIPTLLLQARHDGILPWDVQSQLERHLPNAEVAWIDGPHLLLQITPEPSAEAIAKFLA